MTSAFPALANHLWQSTVFAAVAAALSATLRRNPARIRYALWMCASLKFLAPFSMLVALGGQVEPSPARPAAPEMPATVVRLATPIVASDAPATRPAPPAIPWAVVASSFWALGAAAVARRRWAAWQSIRSVVAAAARIPFDAPVPIVSADVRLEPGVFGFFRPVLLLPRAVLDRLTAAQLCAVLQHELCHVRRRDNLTALCHIFVECVFWFHPLVWWIGGRLHDERERACDEDVLSHGSDPRAYAEALTRVCRICLESPLPCAAGVTGADLKARVRAILSDRALDPLGLARKALLAGAAAFALAGPLAIGVLRAPLLRAQARTGPTLRFAVASIKPTGQSGGRAGIMPMPGGGFRAEGITVHQLILFAYDLQEFQLPGGPSWIHSDGFQIVATPETADTPADAQTFGSLDRVRSRVQSLLADRFGLAVHKTQKDTQAYFLTVAKGGPKLQPSKGEGGGRMMRGRRQLDANRAGIPQLAALLSNWFGRPVVDRTGLTGLYDFQVAYSPEASPAGPEGPRDASADNTGPSIFTALREQLGLELEAAKGPVEVLVIDRVSRPAAN